MPRTMPLPSDAPFADAGELVFDALQAFAPPASMTVAEWAAAKRWLNNTGGGYVGRWQHAEAPYVVAPMEALTDPRFRSVVMVGPAQCAKTACAENWLGHSVDIDPAPMLWFMQSEPALESYVKEAINPMIDLHETTLKARLGLRPVDDSLGFKRFRSMTVQFLPAAPNNLISKRAPRLVLDEEDAYASNLGDVAGILDLRRSTYGDSSKMLRLSHPDRAGGMADSKWTTGIMRGYAASDRRLWYWPCPHCNAWSSPHPLGVRVMALEYPSDAPLDEIRDAARLLCPSCGTLIEDSARRTMNAAGVWIALGQAIDEDGTITGDPVARPLAGFWIVGVMSTLVVGGIGELARARVEAERNATQSGNDENLKTVIVKRWGLAYEPKRAVDQLTAENIANRAEPALKLGIVPDGVRFITCFVDVQGNRFELLFRGWGEGSESWVIATETIAAEPTTSAADWDKLVGHLVTAAFPLSDGTGRVMHIRGAGFDAYGAPGTTLHAYAAWRRWRARGKLGLRARIDGREAWNVIPTKGLGGPNAPPLVTVRPDTQRHDRHAAAGGTVPIAQFNANTFKDALASQLATAQGAFAVHIPAALRSDAEPHIFFEGLVAETRQPNRTWKHTSQHRNEPTDLMVGTHVVAHLHGLARLNWARPPSWAAPWDQNSMVSNPDAPSQRVTVAPAQVPTLPAPAATPAVQGPVFAPVVRSQPFNPGFVRAGRRLA